MNGLLKNFLERKTVFGTIARHRRYKRLEKKYTKWKQKGFVLPMPHFGKLQVLREYAEKFKPAVFIETGTYKGDMVYAMLHRFEQIFSIELDKTLSEKTRQRFLGYQHVQILHGQSGEILPEILKEISKPCLFWLDAHWSGGSTAKGDLETPIIQELKSILKHSHVDEHVILIDDARCFTGENDYPTLSSLKQYVLQDHPGYIFQVEDDIIRIHSRP